jgi:hypothetical protein
MMIVFENEGLIDPLAITTMGLNAKVGENPIGFFGTGLKYAIAVLLRTGHQISIHRGTEELVFTTQSHESRGKRFELVAMNEQPIGFTTELGKKWELWQAFRELWCNCADENGRSFQTDFYSPKEGCTSVTVIGSQFETIFGNRGEFILATRPVKTFKGLQVHPGASRTIFYRGIAVGRLPENQAPLHTYNITAQIDLTEDRTVKYDWEVKNIIAKAIHTATDKEFIEQAVCAPKGSLERSIDHTFYSEKPSQPFIETVERIHRTRAHDMNESAVNHANAHRPLPAIQNFQLDAMEQTQFDAAVLFLESLGYEVREHPIRFVESLGSSVFGSADGGEIAITKLAFMGGTKQLAITLLEEHLHLVTGLHDESRAFQDRLLHELVTLGEKAVLGRAL